MVTGIGKSTDPGTANNRDDLPGGGPASFRYNNPGAQYPSAEAARFGQTGYGIIGGGHKIAGFPSPVNGAAANMDLLNRNYTGMTMGPAGKKWTGSYGFGIPGYPDDTLLTKEMLNDPKLAIAILKAIAGRESGRGNNLTEQQWAQAHQMFKLGSADAYLRDQPTEQEPHKEADGAAKGPTGAGLLRRAREHIGDKYVNVQVPKDDPNWKGPWDCSEFMSWLVYQEASILYGCLDDNAVPSKAKAYTGAWQNDVKSRGKRVPVEEAAATVGGILLRYPPSPGAMGHVVLCDGKGGTVEAKGARYGVLADTVHGRRWDTGVLISQINYDAVGETTPIQAASVYAINAPNMDPAIIVEIQTALTKKAFSPGEIDGEYGPETAAAVAAFQQSEGLVVDGEVGPETAAALGISLTSPKPVAAGGEQADKHPKPIEPVGPGDGTMDPLIMIAARVLPDIVKTIAADKAGTVTAAVTDAVTAATQTKNPDAARDKLNNDPNAYAALHLKLAQIAAGQEQKQQQAPLDQLKTQYDSDVKKRDEQLVVLKAQYEEDGKKRDAQLQQMQVASKDTQDARASLRDMAGQNYWIVATAAPIISYLVTFGFFIALFVLIVYGDKFAAANSSALQIINIVIGALVAAFATVVNFWLGSSQGSRIKDVASLDAQERNAQQNADILDKSANERSQALDKSIKQTDALQSTIKSMVQGAPAADATKTSNLQRCVDIVVAHRVAGTDAAAQFGVTLEELRTARNDNSLTAEDLNNLTREQAQEIYRVRYWNVLRCDDLPVGVDLVVFDFGVEAGAAQSASTLQTVVGAKADGSVGSATIAATKAMPPRDAVTGMTQRRLEYYGTKAESADIKQRRIVRANAVQDAALAMIMPASRGA